MFRADNLILELGPQSAISAVDWVALQGAPTGYRTFASRMADTDTFHYLLRGVDVVARPTGEWEIGRGQFRTNNGVPAIIRERIFASSNGDAAVAFSAGIKHISLASIAPATDEVRFDQQALLGLDMAGQVAFFGMTTPPAGWLKANGAAYSRTTYARLFSRIGTQYGVGDGTSTFNVPDARGEFLRAWDDGRTLDNGRAFGSVQAQLLLSHGHALNDPGHAHGVYDAGHAHSAWTDAQGHHDHAGGWQTTGNADGNAGYGVSIAAGYQNNMLIPGMRGDRRTEATGSHGHNVGVGASGTGVAIYAAGTGMSVAANGGAENRPRNLALAAFIKY
jgi:microcystin-dependent protein